MEKKHRDQKIRTMAFKLAHYIIREKEHRISSTLGFKEFASEKEYKREVERIMHEVRQAIDKEYFESWIFKFCDGNPEQIDRLRKASKPNWFDQMVYELVRYEEDYRNLKKLSKGWLCEIDHKFSEQVNYQITYIEEMMEAFSLTAAIRDLDLMCKTIYPELKQRKRRIRINEILAELDVYEKKPFKSLEQYKAECMESGNDEEQEIDKKIGDYLKPKNKKNIRILSSFLKSYGIKDVHIQGIKEKSGSFHKK